MSEWNLVSEKKFPTEENILLFHDGYHYIGTYCTTEDDVNHYFISHYGLIKPSHWMHLPEIPKKIKEGLTSHVLAEFEYLRKCIKCVKLNEWYKRNHEKRGKVVCEDCIRNLPIVMVKFIEGE